MREVKRAGKDIEIFCIEEHLNTKNTETVDSECGQDSDCDTKQPNMACGVFSFHWLFITSLIQLSIYLNKVYQDSVAVKEYYEEKDVSACTVSSFCLFLPSVMYLLFMVGAYVKDTEDASNRTIATKVVHGLLLVPWQIKERVELLQFSSEHICQKRHLTSDEMKKKSYLERQTALLAFFHQFYAGLIQITLQLHMIISTLDNKKGYKAHFEKQLTFWMCRKYINKKKEKSALMDTI
ncbi:uncharacterized protein LOC118188197 isoform X2 [Stegodyphus dumicola]|uniref:uncharacterized protein LOC118188197 isoform X2 n=1 Tax=Stegodyphus dumicola TaxID=202533 RepID=UPI0015AAD892|nr:uncharacterized protein LOC118188197 isoform X2 [Stegodyphus dumicola]